MKAKHWWKEKNDKDMLYAFCHIYGLLLLLFLILDDEIPNLHLSSLTKKTDIKLKERLTSTCIKQVISKPSDTVILHYLALDAFYVGFFSGINFISVKIFILNDFL